MPQKRVYCYIFEKGSRRNAKEQSKRGKNGNKQIFTLNFGKEAFSKAF